MKNFLKSSLFLKISSVIVAVLLWLYVVQFENPEFQISVSDIPVKYENEQVLTDKQLIITSQSKQAVTLKVKGKRQTVSKLDKSDIIAVIDLKSVTSAGEYNLPVKVTFPSSNLVIADSSIPKIHITAESKTEHEYKVKIKTSGEVKSGYYAIADSSSANVRVIAPQSMSELVTSAQATLDITGADATVENSATIKLFDENGNEVKSRYIKCEPSSTKVRCFVYPVKEVPVIWQETGSTPKGGSPLTPSEKTIPLAGPESLLSEVSSVNLGRINVSSFSPSNNLKFFALDDKLIPEGIYVAGDIKSLTLSMNFKPEEDSPKTESTHVTVKDIAIEGIPEGYTAEILTSSISVKISGEKDIISGIKDTDVNAFIDLSGLTEEELSKSEHEIQVTFLSFKNIIFDEKKYAKVKIIPVEPSLATEETSEYTETEQ